MARPKGSPKLGGRKKGTPNKITVALKDAIIQAAEAAGGPDGLVGYLTAQARLDNPTAFLSLLGKVLPHQIAGDRDNPLAVDVKIKSDEGFQRLSGALGLIARSASGNDSGKV